MKSLMIILTGFMGSWYFTDLESDSIVYSLLAPFSVAFFLIAFALWLVLKAGLSGKARRGISLGGEFGGDGGD